MLTNLEPVHFYVPAGRAFVLASLEVYVRARSTTHFHKPSVCPLQELGGSRRIHPDEQPALTAGGYSHVSSNEEGEPAKHLLLGHIWFTRQQLTKAIGEFLVVGHIE